MMCSALPGFDFVNFPIPRHCFFGERNFFCSPALSRIHHDELGFSVVFAILNASVKKLVSALGVNADDGEIIAF